MIRDDARELDVSRPTDDEPRGRVVGTAAGTAALGLLGLGLAFLAWQIVTGGLNMADVTRRLPPSVAVLVVDDPDESVRFTCDTVDERDLADVQAYAREHDLEVVFDPPGAPPASIASVSWSHWRDRLVVHAGEPPADDARISGACPGE